MLSQQSQLSLLHLPENTCEASLRVYLNGRCITPQPIALSVTKERVRLCIGTTMLVKQNLANFAIYLSTDILECTAPTGTLLTGEPSQADTSESTSYPEQAPER